MLRSGDQQLLRLLARKGGFDRFLKAATYDIRVVKANGKETFYRPLCR
jgi:hypothetical protein